MYNNNWFRVVLLVLLVGVLTLGSFGCAKPSPAPTPTSTPKPAPAPSPKPSLSPSPTPALAPQIPPPGASPIKITYLGDLPLNHIITLGQERFKKLIEEGSKGVITVDLYPAGQLYKYADFPTALETGAASMAIASFSPYTGTCPASLATQVPCGYQNLDHFLRFCDGPYFSIFDSQLKKIKQKLIGYNYYGGLMGIISKEPIRTQADLKGKKIRGMGETVAMFFQALGGTVPVIGSAEVYIALQRGTIDGAFSGVSTFVDRKWFEACKYVILPPNEGSFFPVHWATIWNLDKWNSLPSWAQEMVIQCNKNVLQWQLVEADKIDKQDLATLKKNGVTVHSIPETEWPTWTKAAKVCWDYIVQQDKENGAAILKALEAAR